MRPYPLPQPLRDSPFLVADALPVVGAERLRRGDLARPTRGVRVTRSPGQEVVLDPSSLALVLGRDQFFSHTTAAALWGLPVPRAALSLQDGASGSPPLHVTTIRGGHAMRRRGVVGHRIDRADLETVEGLLLSARVQCWVECGALLALDDLVVLADAIIGRPWFDESSLLEEAVLRRAGRPHAARLREALGLARVGSESPQETRLRLLIVRAGLPEPRLNIDVFDNRGRWLGRPDMVYESARVIVEYEGDHHRTDAATFRRDIRRRERFAAAGWRTLRVVADDLTVHAPEFCARLAQALR